MAQQGSGGNVLAALVSFFFPGMGQLFQGRFIAGFFMFIMSVLLWMFWLGWIMHFVAAFEAARYTSP